MSRAKPSTEIETEGPTSADEITLPAMLQELMQTASQVRATDIHIDPVGHDYLVRFRVDGLVQQHQRLEHEPGHRLINQAKIAAELEIEMSHVPLEGHFHWKFDGSIRDVRVTVMPTFHTEAIHMRLLTSPEQWRDVRNLGLRGEDLAMVQSAMRNPHGLVLVAGTTGAGKTTTLYALAGMHELRDRVAVSIEDPVEFDLDYVRQLRVNEKYGLTMAEGLKTLLRMDPDMLLIGEVRDEESAVTAAHAALAGRLVLATVHARDAATAIENMHYQSVPFYILGGALRLVIAQNLVRCLHRESAEPRDLQDHEKELFDKYGVEAPKQVFEPRECEECRYGYAGRTGVFQVAVVDDDLGSWLAQGHHAQDIRRKLVERGTEPIIVDALRLAAEGVTSMDEVMRFYGHSVDRPLTFEDMKNATHID